MKKFFFSGLVAYLILLGLNADPVSATGYFSMKLTVEVGEFMPAESARTGDETHDALPNVSEPTTDDQLPVAPEPLESEPLEATNTDG